jgi:ribosomal protein S18 acetylase RimI-like enzyme
VQVQDDLLVHLFIDPDHQGAGIGRRLLAIAEALIAEGGHADAELHTRVDNERAIALYESAGWHLTDRLIHSAHDGIEYDEHVLVKHVRDVPGTSRTLRD